MGTSKRERQKANRQQRLEELARQARRDKTKRRSVRIGIVVVGGLVLLFGLAKVFSGSDSTSSTPTLAPVTSIDTGTPVATVTGDTSLATDTTLATDTSLASGTTATGDSTVTSDTSGVTTTEAPTTTTTIAFSYGTAPCPKTDGSSTKPATFDGAPKMCIDAAKSYAAVVKTNKGEFTITLDAKKSPGNVNNFVTLARYHYYDGTGCHRDIKDFVVQCGRPGSDETAPGYTIPDELPSAGEYTEGVIAMANTGSPGSAGGQFFIITGAQGSSLPPSYSIVGTVTKGYDSTVAALENLADPLAKNGVPPLVPIEITSIAITES